MTDSFYLRRSFGSYSSGTRVEVESEHDEGRILNIRFIGNDEVFSVNRDDLIKRKSQAGEVPAKTRAHRRQEKKAAEQLVDSLMNNGKS